MRPNDIEFMIGLLYKRSGLALTPDKEYLLESRLGPIARSHGLDLDGLVAKLRLNPPENLLIEITDAMMTHESSFFRDGKPFEHLRKTILPQLRAAAGTRRTLRIWSAACSTGQEAYSIAITLLEDAVQHPGWNYEIIGTDIAIKVVEKARQGLYSQFEAQRGMPIQTLLKYFKQEGTSWQANDTLRSMARFQVNNLLEDDPPAGLFDLVFCRNVLIYFDDAGKSLAIQHIHNALKPGGFFVMGSSETLRDAGQRFVPLEGIHGIYQKPEAIRPLRPAVQPHNSYST